MRNNALIRYRRPRYEPSRETQTEEATEEGREGGEGGSQRAETMGKGASAKKGPCVRH